MKYSLEETASGTMLRIVSFNVRMDVYDVDGHKGGIGELNELSKNRIKAVCEQVLSFEPQLVGFQEDVNNWVNNMSLGDRYVCYRPSVTHTVHTMEYCSIYVKKGIAVKDSGWRWLTSDGTSATVALTYDGLIESGKMSAEELAVLGHTQTENTVLKKNGLERDRYSLAARLMNYVVLDVGGENVIYVNTHLQHRGHNTGNYAAATDVYKLLYKLRFLERCAQMKMLEETVASLKEKYGTERVIMTADFNDQPIGLDYGTGDKNFYGTVIDSGWNDCALVAKDTVDSDTGNTAFYKGDISLQGQGYDAEDVNGGNDGRIDYCFVSDSLKSCVERYFVGEYSFIASNGVKVYPSDHLPIVTDILMKREGK